MNLGALSDSELMASLYAVCSDSRRLLAKLLVHLNEVEERRLDAKAAMPSLFEFCIRRLGMSEGEACRRIAAARLVKRFPSLLARVESGALHLTNLELLKEHFTDGNVEDLARAASGKTKREVQELVARLAPKPDVPAAITELPPPAVVLPFMPQPAIAPPLPSRVAPLSEHRYEVRFTAGTALRDKIERAKDLLRHRHPNGDLEAVMDRAFDALIAQLEKERTGASNRPQRHPKPTRTAHIPRAVRREVFARDGERCTYVDAEGNRCPATGHLEIDHIESKGFGGASIAPNLRVFCRTHNRLHEEQDFGKTYVAEKIHHRQRGLDPSFEPVKRGLLNMGFSATETNRVLSRLSNSHELQSQESLLRAALAMLTTPWAKHA